MKVQVELDDRATASTDDKKDARVSTFVPPCILFLKIKGATEEESRMHLERIS
jgi:hypothetical protein